MSESQLRGVTITGVDQATDLSLVRALGEAHPFLEWGVLLSAKAQGEPRYPHLAWVERLREVLPAARLAGHVCGRWAREILAGRRPDELPLVHFDRVQLNVSGALDGAGDLRAAAAALPRGPTYIVQAGADREAAAEFARTLGAEGHRSSLLFDLSGGRGITPEGWPRPVPGIAVGYAGGLGPENLQAELARIVEVASGVAFWVDMEGRVRTPDDAGLDFDKIRRVLEAATRFRAEGSGAAAVV